MDNVFDKLDGASNSGQGIELTPSEVWLLMELAGEEIAKAGGHFEHCREMIEDYEREKSRDA